MDWKVAQAESSGKASRMRRFSCKWGTFLGSNCNLSAISHGVSHATQSATCSWTLLGQGVLNQVI